MAALLDSLLTQSQAPREIVITDGGSTDRTTEIVHEYTGKGHPIRLIETDHAFPGRGRNLAIESTRNEWIAMTDAGCLPSSDWLERLLEPVEQNRQIDVVYGSYEPVMDTYFQECAALSFVAPHTFHDGQPMRCPTTASLLLRKSVWKSVGGFREDLRACEDLLFFEKLRTANPRVAYAPKAVVKWSIPGNVRSLFRRFRLYSQHTLRAGLAHAWHTAILRMYAVGVVLLILTVLHSVWWISGLLAFVILRAVRNVAKRRWSLPLRYRVTPLTYLMVAVLTLVIDAAMFAGVADYCIARRHSSLSSSSSS